MNRREFLALLGASACDRTDLDEYMAKQVIPIRLNGLNTKTDDELSIPSDISTLENMVASKRTDGGFAFKKRFGITALTRNIEPSGSISAGAKVAAYGDELVCTDGGKLYSYDATLAKWITKGFVSDISANVTPVLGNSSLEFQTIRTAIDCDVAYTSGYACFVMSTNNSGTPTPRVAWFVQDLTTGNVVGQGIIDDSTTNIASGKVVAMSGKFYIFYWKDGTNTVRAIRISASAPTAIDAGPSTIASDYHSTVGRYDIIADTSNSKILFAYRSSTPDTRLKRINTDLTVATSVTYVTRDPDLCLGWMEGIFSGFAYLAIGVSAGGAAAGVRRLKVDVTNVSVNDDVLIDNAATDAILCGGINTSASNDFLIYSRAAAGVVDTYCYNGFSGVSPVMQSVAIRSKPVLIGTKIYYMVSYDAGNGSYNEQRSLFLMEMDKTGASPSFSRRSCRIAGFLMNDSYGLTTASAYTFGAMASVSSTRVLFTAPSFIDGNWSMEKIDVDFAGTNTGAPVQFDGLLFFPSAAAKVYDGRTVFENGFYVRPDAPKLAQTTGGSLTLLSVIQAVAVYSYMDNTGRLWRSAASDPTTITLTGSNNKVNITVKNLRATERDELYGISSTQPIPVVRIEVYVVKPGQTNFFLLTTVDNDCTSATQVVAYSTAVDGTSEILYTNSGEVPNEYPPAVLSFASHGNRLFALSGDGAVWYTKEISDGVAAASAALFRIPFDSASGSFVGMASLDTGLVISKESRLYLLTGQGPTPDGNGLYSYPLALPAEVGFATARSWGNVQDGILFKSQSGWFMLNRGGEVEPVEGIDDYDSLTVVGGIALTTRPFVVFPTSSGTVLVYDWQLKLWYVWTGYGTVTSVARWQDQLVFLQLDGTVQKEVSNQYNDNTNAIQSKMILGWVNVGDVFANARTYNVELLLKIMASFTLSVQLAYDDKSSDTDTARTKSVTTADAGVLMVPLGPGRGRSQSILITMLENSTTQGFVALAFGLEVQLKQGARKQATSKFLT